MIETPDPFVVTSTRVSDNSGKSRGLADLMTDDGLDCVKGTRSGFLPENLRELHGCWAQYSTRENQSRVFLKGEELPNL
jgi:hypothetical protein